jgi:hypothetical protein
LVDDYLVNQQVAGQSVSALNDHGFHAIGFDSIEKSRESWSLTEILCSTHRLVAILVEDLEALRRGESSNAVSLSVESVAVNLRFPAHSEVSESRTSRCHRIDSDTFRLQSQQ